MVIVSLYVVFTSIFEHLAHLGQLRHVMDERKLLSLMNSRFVLKLHGTVTALLPIALPLLLHFILHFVLYILDHLPFFSFFPFSPLFMTMYFSFEQE